MGRLPSTFAGREITARTPYNMEGEIILAPSLSGQTYPDSTFLNAVNRPFEVHRMVPRVIALDDEELPVDPQPSDLDLLMNLVKITVENLTANDKMTKAAQLISTLVKGSAEQTWEWAEPYYLPNSHQFLVTLNTEPLPDAADYTQLKIAINFQGFLLQVAPASESR
jgi:hypothetical protein